MPTVRLLRIASLARITSFAALASACAVTHETTAARVQLDEGVAKTQASALEAAVAGASTGDGVAVADAIARIANTASALVPQAKGGAGHRPLSGTTTCACDASAKRCSFAGCTIRGAVVRGALAWADGRILCSDLEVDVAEGASPLGTAHATLACELTFDASHVAGTVRTIGSAAVSGTTYAWDATITANDVTIAAGRFTGGSLDAQASVSVTGVTAATKDYAATAEVALP
jgi:hypothetical protein